MNGNKRKLPKLILLLLLIAALTAGGGYALWRAGAFLPRWIAWTDADFSDETGNYRIVLDNRHVTVSRQGNPARQESGISREAAGRDDGPSREAARQDNAAAQDSVIWTSPKGVLVQKVLSADVDNDGREELVLLCWKTGRYGRDRPFWVEKDEKKWSQHLFVYEYGQEIIRPQWMSSFLGKDLTDVSVYRRADNLNRLLFTDSDGEISCWKWDSWGFTLEDAAVSFAAFGDNLLHDPLWHYGLQNDKAFSFLFENLRDVIADSDVAVINQETPLVEDPALYGGYPRFGTPLGVGQAIADTGFDIVTCATNHALDRGPDGVNTTKEFFDSRDILCLGIQAEDAAEYRPYEIMMRKGIRFALLNYTYGTNGIKVPDTAPHMVHLLKDEAQIREDIENARADADFILLFVHWGTENSPLIDEDQKKWSRIFLESHVDVVIGTHPHILQPYEVLTAEDGHEMLVYYSLGNYISAQSQPYSIKGGMAGFTVSPSPDGYKITEYGLTPLAVTWHKGGRYTVDYVQKSYPDPDSFFSNSDSGIGLE